MLVVYAGAVPERAVTMQVGAALRAVAKVNVHAVAAVPVVNVPRMSLACAMIVGPVPQEERLLVVSASELPANTLVPLSAVSPPITIQRFVPAAGVSVLAPIKIFPCPVA